MGQFRCSSQAQVGDGAAAAWAWTGGKTEAPAGKRGEGRQEQTTAGALGWEGGFVCSQVHPHTPAQTQISLFFKNLPVAAAPLLSNPH